MIIVKEVSRVEYRLLIDGKVCATGMVEKDPLRCAFSFKVVSPLDVYTTAGVTSYEDVAEDNIRNCLADIEAEIAAAHRLLTTVAEIESEVA